MPTRLTVSIFAATATMTAAKNHEMTPRLEIPLLKYKRLAHKNSIAANKNFEKWRFDDEKKSRHGRHLDRAGFNAWLNCQEENGDSCPSLDTVDQAYWNCYAFDEGCDSEAVNAPEWYDCYWMNTGCPEPEPETALFTWDAYLECQESKGRAASKPAEREQCQSLDTSDERFWNCYWEDTTCAEANGNADWYNCYWYPSEGNTCGDWETFDDFLHCRVHVDDQWKDYCYNRDSTGAFYMCY